MTNTNGVTFIFKGIQLKLCSPWTLGHVQKNLKWRLFLPNHWVESIYSFDESSEIYPNFANQPKKFNRNSRWFPKPSDKLLMLSKAIVLKLTPGQKNKNLRIVIVRFVINGLPYLYSWNYLPYGQFNTFPHWYYYNKGDSRKNVCWCSVFLFTSFLHACWKDTKG